MIDGMFIECLFVFGVGIVLCSDVWVLLCDYFGIVWVGSYGGGLMCYVFLLLGLFMVCDVIGLVLVGLDVCSIL